MRQISRALTACSSLVAQFRNARHAVMAKVDHESWTDDLAVYMVTTVDAWPTWIKKVITFSCFVVCALLLRSMSRTMNAQEERDRAAKLEQKQKSS